MSLYFYKSINTEDGAVIWCESSQYLGNSSGMFLIQLGKAFTITKFAAMNPVCSCSALRETSQLSFQERMCTCELHVELGTHLSWALPDALHLWLHWCPTICFLSTRPPCIPWQAQKPLSRFNIAFLFLSLSKVHQCNSSSWVCWIIWSKTQQFY